MPRGGPCEMPAATMQPECTSGPSLPTSRPPETENAMPSVLTRSVRNLRAHASGRAHARVCARALALCTTRVHAHRMTRGRWLPLSVDLISGMPEPCPSHEHSVSAVGREDAFGPTVVQRRAAQRP